MVRIPDKLYFKIGEVAQIAKVEAYVLRYWESEFKEISPIKSKSKQRLYRRKDIETVLLIKQLLYAEKFTIEGAKKQIREFRGEKDATKESGKAKEGQLILGFDGRKNGNFLDQLRVGLNELIKILEK